MAWRRLGLVLALMVILAAVGRLGPGAGHFASALRAAERGAPAAAADEGVEADADDEDSEDDEEEEEGEDEEDEDSAGAATEEESDEAEDEADGTDGGEKAASGPLKFSDMNVAQLRDYQAFAYVSSGRDPMTFRNYVPRLPTAKTADGTGAAPKVEGPSEQEKEAMLNESLLAVEAQITQFAYAEAIKTADDAFELVKSWGGIKQEKAALWQLYELLQTYRSLAERMDKAEKIRKEFENIRLDVTGIFWSPAAARAIVNNKSVEPGQVLDDSPPTGQVRVEEIGENGVAFQYRNFRFWRPLSGDVAGTGAKGGKATKSK